MEPSGSERGGDPGTPSLRTQTYFRLSLVSAESGESVRRLWHTWRRMRMAELESKHLTWNEIKGAAQNRVRWRALVEDLCSTRNEED